MKQEFTPILIVPAVSHGDGIRFLHRECQLDVDLEIAGEIWKILEYCNGHNDVSAISEFSGLPFMEVEELLSQLVELEVVVDSREQYLHFNKICSYPSVFNYDLSQDEIVAYTRSPRKPVKSGKALRFNKIEDTFFSDVLKKRRSCRNFSDEKLSIDQIGSICHYAYSIRNHAVPSGGGLYPLKIYVLVEKGQDGLEAGYYEYDAEGDCLVLFNLDVDEEQLKYCFNQEGMPFGSAVQIVIAADLKRQSAKYANRGYVLTLLEAGHAAENISLFCAEQGLGACELGGILSEPLGAELKLDCDVCPLVAIAVGYRSDVEDAVLDKLRYVEAKVGDGRPVEKVWAKTFGGDGAFFGATAVYRDGNNHHQYAGATSRSYNEAIFKAAVEGYERWASGQVRSDYHGPANSLANWAHPYDFFPLTEEQAEKCGVAYFTEDLPIDWVIGRKFDGTEVYVPSDIVYYGHKAGENRIYNGHSSGVAAYSDFQEAEKRAIVELIERDALMRNWYTHKAPYVISDGTLPVHVRKRMRHWFGRRRRTFVLEMPSDYGWVFVVVIVSSDYPCFVSGAAATIEESKTTETIYKALQEAEYNLLSCIDCPNDSKTEVDPEKVFTPIDHGKLYHTKKYADTLAWLWNGCLVDSFAQIKERSIAELKSELETITVNLSDPRASLSVVRVLSLKLVQINFGFHSAHYSYPYLNPCAESLRLPHYFA